MLHDEIQKSISAIEKAQAEHNADDLLYQEKNDGQNQAILKSIDQLNASHSALVTSLSPVTTWFDNFTRQKQFKLEYQTTIGYWAKLIVVVGAAGGVVVAGTRWLIIQILAK